MLKLLWATCLYQSVLGKALRQRSKVCVWIQAHCVVSWVERCYVSIINTGHLLNQQSYSGMITPLFTYSLGFMSQWKREGNTKWRVDRLWINMTAWNCTDFKWESVMQSNKSASSTILHPAPVGGVVLCEVEDEGTWGRPPLGVAWTEWESQLLSYLQIKTCESLCAVSEIVWSLCFFQIMQQSWRLRLTRWSRSYKVLCGNLIWLCIYWLCRCFTFGGSTYVSAINLFIKWCHCVWTFLFHSQK